MIDILGIYNGKNAGITYIKNNKIILSVSEERFSRIKNHRGYPFMSLDYLKKNFKIDFKNKINITIGSWQYPEKDILRDYFKFQNINSYERIYNSLKTDFEYANDFIINTKKLFPNSKINFYDHHLCHYASSLFFEKTVNNTYGIVSDGRGALKSLSIYLFKSQKIKNIISFPEYCSFGAFYGSITYLLGFTPDKHEGKITGLAAFGKKTNLINKFNQLISFENNQIITSPKFIPFIRPNNLDYLKKITKSYSKENIAYAAQYLLETNIIKIIKKFIPKNSILKASGGIFSNVKLNQKIRENCNLKSFVVFPEMTDGGISYGSAVLGNFYINNKKTFTKNVYLGPHPGEKINKQYKKQILIYKYKNLNKLALKVSELIAQDFIIGICRGKMEYGPRALGNRSILFSPKKLDKINLVNKRLGRNEFMPFAPVLLKKNTTKLFKNYIVEDINTNYMTTCYNCTKFMINKFPTVVHVDNTARPQLIDSSHENKLYYLILKFLDKMHDIQCAVNTSFNTHDEPIVNNCNDAIKNLIKGSIDYLVLNDCLISKNN